MPTPMGGAANTRNHHAGPAWKSGAGGNRTPVPRQSASRFYACVHSFDLDPWDEDWHPSHGSSPRCCLAGHPRARRMFASLMFVIPRLIRRVAGDAQPVLGRESVIAIVSNYCVACFLRGQHAPRRATAGLPCSVETSSAPDVKEETGPGIVRVPRAKRSPAFRSPRC